MYDVQVVLMSILLFTFRVDHSGIDRFISNDIIR